jgi:hypothetical protein
MSNGEMPNENRKVADGWSFPQSEDPPGSIAAQLIQGPLSPRDRDRQVSQPRSTLELRVSDQQRWVRLLCGASEGKGFEECRARQTELSSALCQPTSSSKRARIMGKPIAGLHSQSRESFHRLFWRRVHPPVSCGDEPCLRGYE